MSPAHSPAPWRIDAAGDDWFDVFDAHGLSVAEAIMSPDARLIAAAPDMLVALQELEEFLDNQADADDGRPNDAMRHLIAVRAALTKAEGHQ